jgi:hypothetical protein
MGGNRAAKQASQEAQRARGEEEARQGRIRAGTALIDQTFSKFDDNYFDGIARSYTDFARPQVEEQLGDAREQLTYSLGRAGILDSSIRSNQAADLQRDADIQFQDVADQGRKYATSARNSVEDARANLVATLQATADNTGTANAAINRAQALASEPTYSPVGQLFTDVSAGLEQQAALERAAAFGYGPRPRINTGLFGAPNSAVKVSR